MYVIKRYDDRKYVARRGMASSYTDKLQNARTYDTHHEAMCEACSNERVISVEAEIKGELVLGPVKVWECSNACQNQNA